MTQLHHLTQSLLFMHLPSLSCESVDDPSICRNGCQLLYNEYLPCDSEQAFVPNHYFNRTDTDITDILSTASFICFDPQIPNEAVYIENHQIDPGSFSFHSYVFMWQSIIIAVVIPLIVLVLIRLIQLLLHCACRSMRCKQDSKCWCFLYCLSAEYRQQRRNQKFHREIYNDESRKSSKEEQATCWRLANRSRASMEHKEEQKEDDSQSKGQQLRFKEKGKHQQYLGVPLDDHLDGGSVPDNVLESVSVSVGNGELDKYLEAPGKGAGQGVELSFSSHGLRQISYRDVV